MAAAPLRYGAFEILRPECSARIGIAINLALEIAQQEIIAIAADDRIRRDQDLSAAAGRVDAEARRRIAGGMSAQCADDLDSRLDAGAKMAGAADRITLIEVVRLHPAGEQSVHEGLHHRRIIVDAFEKHRLAAERNAGIGKPRGRLRDFGGQLPGMREMNAHPEWMMLLQHLCQALGDPLRQDRGYLGADAQELDVLDRAQPSEQPVELVVADTERIASGQQHVAYLGMRFEIGERLLPLAGRKLVFAAGIADEPRARAVAAIG